MQAEPALYNSRITRSYIDYLAVNHPEVEVDGVLEHAGISRHQVQDPGAWFTQGQVDRLNRALCEATGNPRISRDVGRAASNSLSTGAVGGLVLGLMSLEAALRLLDRIAPRVTRGATMRARKLGPRRYEVVSEPMPGVDEKPYQCDNRLGQLEALVRLFSVDLGALEHTECVHRGGACCRYEIEWRASPAQQWRRIGVGIMLAVAVIVAVGWVVLSPVWWLRLIAAGGLAGCASYLRAQMLQVRELRRVIRERGDSASALIHEIEIRHNHSHLVQEIGTAVSTILDVDQLLGRLAEILEARLDYDRACILVHDPERDRLECAAGFGGPDRSCVRCAGVDVDAPELYAHVFRTRRPLMLNDVHRGGGTEVQALARATGAQSLIAVPVVYESEALGVLCVESLQPNRVLYDSDLALLSAVAAQAAVAMTNAMSFRRLRASEEEYRQLVEGANSVILRFDTEGWITFSNSFAQQLFGLADEEMRAQNVVGTVLPEGEATKAAMARLYRAVRQDPDRVRVRETVVRIRDGRTAWIAWTVRPIVDDTGHLEGLLAIGSDVTALRRAQEEQHRLTEQLQHVQKMEAIGTLAGGVAHDFNNLLTGIRGNLSLILEDADPAEARTELLREVDGYVRSATGLTRQLLGLARGGRYQVRATDLNELVGATSRMFGRTQKHLQIRTDLQGGLWSVEVDQGQIEQTLLNHFLNAAQAMPGGGQLVVRTANCVLDEETTDAIALPAGRYVRVSIIDDGVGMAPEVMARIFDPFYTTRERERGTGLGLASAYGIVQNHGGTITVDSEPGVGTTFDVYLPASEAVVETIDQVDSTVVPGEATILLVDDERLIAEVGRRLLLRLGYQVVVARSGEEAVERYDPAEIDLVILDLVMPGMTGAETFQRLMELDPQVRILISSGYSAEGEAARLLSKGAWAFLQKPFGITEISRRVAEVLESRGG